MNIEHWLENSLPPPLLEKGVEFIRRRFLEEWRIYRTDVTKDTVLRRKNLILFDNSNIIGWLGIESNGELTNACIEKGYKGIYNLIKLIKVAYKISPSDRLYANVPIIKIASALAFLKAGMRLEKEPHIIRLKYPEKDVTLVRLSMDKKRNHLEANHPNSIKAILKQIEELNYVYRYNQISDRDIQE